MPTPYSPASDGLSRLTEIMRVEPERPTPPGHARAPKRRRRGLAALIAGLVVLILAGSAGGYAVWALGAPIGAATVDAEAPSVPELEPVEIVLSRDASAAALSVSGADEFLGPEASGVWLSQGGDDPRPMASLVKLVAALVILDAKGLTEAGDPGPTLTFSRADHALYDKYYVLGATIAAMPAGSSLTLHQALEAMLIVSACNYAEAVTTWAFGSQSAYRSATRAWLDAHGLTGTTIVDPTGLDPRNTSTPSDLLALGRLALAHPIVAEIVAMTRLEVPNIPSTLATNSLLGTDGITGLKTGTLEESGANLLYSATVDVGLPQPLSIVGVTLGAYTRESINLEVRGILADLRAGFQTVQLGARGARIGTYSTPWGESADIVLGEQASQFVWSNPAITSSFEVDPITTGAKGDTVGTMTWVVGTAEVSVPLQLAGDIDPPDAWWRLTHPDLLG